MSLRLAVSVTIISGAAAAVAVVEHVQRHTRNAAYPATCSSVRNPTGTRETSTASINTTGEESGATAVQVKALCASAGPSASLMFPKPRNRATSRNRPAGTDRPRTPSGANPQATAHPRAPSGSDPAHPHGPAPPTSRRSAYARGYGVRRI